MHERWLTLLSACPSIVPFLSIPHSLYAPAGADSSHSVFSGPAPATHPTLLQSFLSATASQSVSCVLAVSRALQPRTRFNIGIVFHSLIIMSMLASPLSSESTGDNIYLIILDFVIVIQ